MKSIVDYTFRNGTTLKVNYDNSELRIDEESQKEKDEKKETKWITIRGHVVGVRNGKYINGPLKGQEYKPN